MEKEPYELLQINVQVISGANGITDSSDHDNNHTDIEDLP